MKNTGIAILIIGLLLTIFTTFNYFTRENIQVKFDSKENVDKNYEGSLFYYTR